MQIVIRYLAINCFAAQSELADAKGRYGAGTAITRKFR